MILLLIALTAAPAHTRVPCWIVKAYVGTLGPVAARAKGHEHGYTDAEIDAVRVRCGIVAPKQGEGGIK